MAIYFCVVGKSQLQLELELAKVQLEQLKISANRRGSASSGLYTPRSPVKTGIHTPTKKSSSVGYYFDQLSQHFKANNDTNRYAITCTRHLCQVYDGKKVIHQEDVDLNDSTSIRNLYLMFYASNYDVGIFLQKRESGEFTAFSGTGNVTPPQ